MEKISIKTYIPVGFEKAYIVMLCSLCSHFDGQIDAVISSDNYELVKELAGNLSLISGVNLIKYDTEMRDFESIDRLEVSALSVFDGNTTDICDRSAILVFDDKLPWDGSGLHNSQEKIWWSYARLTPFYREFQECFLQSSLSDTELENLAITLIDEIVKIDEALQEANQILKKMKK